MPKGFIPVNKPQTAVATTATGIPNVSYMRPEVVNALSRWDLISDCLDGEDAVKAKKDKYLPVPDEESGGKVTDPRYKNYLTRAVFYGVTARTLIGLVGQVFGRDSVIEMPTSMEMMVEDVEGTGTGLEQQAKKALEYTLAYGRGGLLADFPKTGGVVTRAQMESGEMRPIIKLYDPRNIINWRTRKVGAKTLLCLVVLRETMDVEDDGFETKTAVAYRVLKLDEKTNVYSVQVFVEQTVDGKVSISEVGPAVEPTKADGSKFDQIPFTFFGPENNDPDLDSSPLYTMATLNIAHYRNSADFEDACFIAGQPTPVFAGLTEEWVNNVMKGKVYLGSRGGIMLPKDGSAQLLQPSPNSMPKEAMDMKEGQMRALGAKLVEERSIRRTATEATQDEASETSILSSATKNVTAAYQHAIMWAQAFTPEKGEFKFELNSDFDLSNMTPQERQQLIAEWQAEAITWSEMRSALKRARIASEDDAEALANIKENPPASSLMAQAALDAKAGAGDDEEDDNKDDNTGGNTGNNPKAKTE